MYNTMGPQHLNSYKAIWPTRSINSNKAFNELLVTNALAVNLMVRAWNSTTVSHTANKQEAAKWAENLLDPL